MRRLLIICLALIWTGSVGAQSTCNNGLPCGSIPWALPRLPALASPTPMPTLELPAGSGSPGEPTPTAAPYPTATAIVLDTSGIEVQLDTLTNMLAATPVLIDSEYVFLPNQPELLTNGDFSLWSDGNPVAWSKQNFVGSNTATQILPNGLLITSDGTQDLRINQIATTTGMEYTFTVDIESISNGQIRFGTLTGSGHTVAYDTPGIHTGNFIASDTVFRLWRSTYSGTLQINSISLILATDTEFTSLSADAGTFFSYLRGFDTDLFGPFTPLVVLLPISVVLIFTVKATSFLLPVVASLVGIVRKLVSLVLDFLPL